jgi:predicted ATP-grasp superfamily ATP-dependent carboligase
VVAEHFELVGLFGIDFVLDGEMVWTLEVNPRYTASVEIMERFSGVRAIAAHVAACNGQLSGDERAGASPPPASPPQAGAEDGPARRGHYGKAVLFARRDLQISPAFADETLAEATRAPWPALADVSPAGTPIEAGRPILTLFADGSTTEEVERRLRHRAMELENKLYLAAGH